VVTGIAALLMSYFPELEPRDVRRIIIESATPLRERSVVVPGEDERVARFEELASSGGIVNAFEAIRMAQRMVGEQ
jgi:hypothetical protein